MASIAYDAGSSLKESLLADLAAARWHPGQRLPTERRLGELHGVSRASVRRALAELKALGVIRQRVGSGTYVMEDVAERLPRRDLPEGGVSPADLMEARLVFEPGMVDLAVRNGTSADFSQMETCCDNAEIARTLQEFEHWDGAFHRKLAEATRNAFLVEVCDLASKVRDQGEWGLLKRRSATPERRAAYQLEHRAVVTSLRQRDSATAKQKLVAHLIHVRRNMFDDTTAPPVSDLAL